jgi:cysteinyl-tRNA synthetase
MELKLYDTLTREKRTFTPLDPANVRMYVCGPTVYDFAHIGNARPVIVFDVLFRLLRHLYGADHVTYVRNITDVDDKINARAAEEYPDLPLNEAIRKVTEKTDKQFHEDVAALGCLTADQVNLPGKPPAFIEPRATEHIGEMRALIERLIVSGNAYVAADHVLFFVPSMTDYGQLAKRSLDEMIEGARVEVAPYKRDPMDFVLWKPSKPGEPAWPSPAGIATPGRPGWHIECSAMSWRYLGEVFDIHGGGIDLVFPHHENEIAQTRCAFHTPLMANFWMHNGFLQVEGEKMAKSLGNFVAIRQLIGSWAGYSWPGDAIRFNMLRSHYRHPIDWTPHSLDESHKVLWNWYEFCKDIRPSAIVTDAPIEALCDDLNTPEMIAALHRLHKEKRPKELLASLRFLGFTGDKAQLNRNSTFVQDTSWEVAADLIAAQRRLRTNRVSAISSSESNPPAPPNSGVVIGGDQSTEQINWLIVQRNEARKNKNFGEADRIRDELAKMGVVLHDTKDGTTWEIAR